MKNPIRVMALQTEQTPSIEPAPGGGIPEIDQMLAAALCAGMPRRWYLAARLKWCLDWSVANELEYMLWVEAAGIAAKEKWRIPTGKYYVRKMAGLAIAEVGDPARYSRPEHWHIKAQWLGTGKSQWFGTWERRYNAIYEELDDWCSRAKSYLYRRQADGESTT